MKILYVIAPVALSLMSTNAQSSVNSGDVQSRVNDVVSSLKSLMSSSETSIPTDLVRGSKCVAEIELIKGGFIFGGEGGYGLASCRGADGRWGAPLFVDLSGISWGWQVGMEKVDLTLVYTRPQAADDLGAAEFQLSGDVGLTVGPVGRDLSAGTDFQLKDAIYSYSTSKGLFAGMTLVGSVMSPDTDYNRYVYGDSNANRILKLNGASTPSAAMPYVEILNQY